jgi:tryptophan synthase alpha chain
VAVGFGISDPEQARAVAGSADAVVVGSAVVNQIGKGGAMQDVVNRVKAFTRELIKAVKDARNEDAKADQDA